MNDAGKQQITIDKIMKKLLLLLAIPFLFIHCKKDEPALFTITIPTTDFVILNTFQPFEEHFIPGNNGDPVFVNVTQQFTDAGYDISEIKRILPRRARLSANFNEVQLDFIRALSIRVCQEVGTDNICNQEVFYLDPLPFDPGFSVDLIPSAVSDVQETIYTDNLFIQLRLEELIVNPPQSFSVRLEMTFEVQ